MIFRFIKQGFVKSLGFEWLFAAKDVTLNNSPILSIFC